MPATPAAPHPIAPPTRPKVPVASPPSLRSPAPYPAIDPPIDQLRSTASQSLSVQQAFCAAAHTAPAATGRSMKRPRPPCARHPLFWHLVQLPLPPTRASRRRSIADAAAPRKISLPEPHQPRSHSANPNACTVANFSGYDALGQMHLPGRVRFRRRDGFSCRSRSSRKRWLSENAYAFPKSIEGRNGKASVRLNEANAQRPGTGVAAR